MSDGEASREANFEKASEELNEGLKTCRTVLDHYRGILVGDQPDEVVPGDGVAQEPSS